MDATPTHLLSPHTEALLKRFKIDGISDARERGYDRMSRLPGVGQKVLKELFPDVFSAKDRRLSPAELDLARRWFNALQDSNPAFLSTEDRRLADKLEAWASGS